MKDDTSGSTLKGEPKTNWKRLRTLTDEQVSLAVQADPDIHPTDERFWDDARVVMPKSKQVVTMRLDADLLAWFRRERGYQTKINAILRTYKDAHDRRR